ncbi:hypothetical protein Lalb_Chr18g0054531 [Lupinus albus]|uniref:Uncharacterized protein n=1 Tax=Lupinus albus TaxID=3870 RepID=A0A6A4P5V4_LUPAL|nr:hypothetical protein Lalb_Chr18g0054531 [Lupinus albus]
MQLLTPWVHGVTGLGLEILSREGTYSLGRKRIMIIFLKSFMILCLNNTLVILRHDYMTKAGSTQSRVHTKSYKNSKETMISSFLQKALSL